MIDENILLPGTDYQIEFLCENVELEAKRILVVGSACEIIAKILSEKSNQLVDLIVEDYESLINSKLFLENNDQVRIRIMDFEVTDFDKSEFDLVYAQSSLSDYRRKGIVKELKRVLKDDGILCVGEIIKFENELPVFVEEILDSSDLDPLHRENINQFYYERNFALIKEKEFNKSLKSFYTNSIKKLEDSKKELTEDEKSYYKKLLKKISHESNAFLNLGADKFIGFKSLILKKEVN